MLRKWSNVSGNVSIPAMVNPAGHFVFSKPIAKSAAAAVKLPPRAAAELAVAVKGPLAAVVEVNLEIDFLSSGYFDPGSMYGGSDHLGWPPEGEDVRECDGPIHFEITCEDIARDVSGVFSEAASAELFEACAAEIDDAECDSRDADDGRDFDDEPDYASVYDRADDE